MLREMQRRSNDARACTNWKGNIHIFHTNSFLSMFRILTVLAQEAGTSEPRSKNHG
jgi:hypothetical protein